MSNLTRTPLSERASAYPAKKERSFRGGKFNLHTPREGHWLPERVRGKHKEGIFKSGSKGKRKKRRGSFLRDEPLRHRAEPIRKSIGSSLLVRTDLLLDETPLAEADERQRRLERAAAAGDSEAGERLHRHRVRADAEGYAREMRKRVDNGDTHHTTIRRYTETLHRAFPHVVDHFDKWAHHRDAVWRLRNNRHLVSKKFDSDVIHHGGEALSAHRNGETEARLTGHRSVYFLRTPKPTQKPDSVRARHEHRELKKKHLSRVHQLLSPEGQPSISWDNDSGVAHHEHYHDEHPSPNEAKETAEIHRSVLRHHFPNADVDVVKRTQAETGMHTEYDRTNVRINNLHDLKPRSSTT
jgi:hypothetical protein